MRAAVPSLVSSFAPDVARLKRRRGDKPCVSFGVHGPADPAARISMALLGMAHAIAALSDSVAAAVEELPEESRELEATVWLERCVEDLRVVRSTSRRIAVMACDDRLVPLLLPGASLSAYLRTLGGFVAAALDVFEDSASNLGAGASGPESLALRGRMEAARACYRPELARSARLDVALLPLDSRRDGDALMRLEDHLQSLAAAAETLYARMG
jgi:hypothetical protein